MNEQVRRRPETKWIHPRLAVSSEIERRAGKELNAVVILVPTTAVVAAPGVIAAGGSAEAAAVAVGLEAVAVAGAKEFVGRFLLRQRRPAQGGAAVVSEVGRSLTIRGTA